MKRVLSMTAAAVTCLCLSGCTAKSKTGVIIFAILTAIAFALALVRTISVIRYNRNRKKTRKAPKNQNVWTIFLLSVTAILLLITLGLAGCFSSFFEKQPEEEPEPPATTEPVVTEPPVVFIPEKTQNSDPDNWGITWEIFQGEEILPSYDRPDKIRFFEPENYFALPGISAFRGNNYRNSATYGTAVVTDERISSAWTAETGKLKGSRWTGSGWTGQPLIVKWDDETRQMMNIYPEKKADAELVEVIYATLDGRIYFLDLHDGSRTRDPINMGMCFKGAGSLDPRGYPLMYVGAGDVNGDYERPRMFIISLIDGSVLYEYGYEEPMQLREDNGGWCAFDSSPLVHGETDTLIWPGENGLLYTIRLNTQYDPAIRSISIDPDTPVAIRYTTERSGKDAYWLGFEASASIMGSYLYISENGGMFFCIDLNTMELVWAQDTQDDSNGSPVFQYISEEEAYIYTAPSLLWTQGDNGWGPISIYKLNALTGEIVWEAVYDVATMDGVSGGVQATALLGKEGTSIEGLLIVPVARYHGLYCGALLALDIETGEQVWEMYMPLYAWSSPVAVYEPDGNAYVVIGDAEGTVTLVEGATGIPVDSTTVFSIVEASPIVYGNRVVVGTRGYSIRCMTVE